LKWQTCLELRNSFYFKIWFIRCNYRFEDDLGTYLPRQLIAEKSNQHLKKIPSGFGTPQMGPITGAWRNLPIH
jgi:Cu/Ag efflux pump CusA